MKNALNYIYPVCILLFLVFEYYSLIVNIYFIDTEFLLGKTYDTILSLVFLFVFHFILILVLYSYFRSMYMNPG